MNYLTLTAALLMNMSIMAQENIYDFTVDGLDGGKIDFSEYRGKKILIVNTASKCGFTKQYSELQELYEAHGSELVVVGFPANNFGGQEPGSNAEIADFCQKNYGVTFPMAAKVSVKGDDQAEIFTWLCAQDNPDHDGKIKWNFEKFLVNEEGQLIHRYRSGTKPMSADILDQL